MNTFDILHQYSEFLDSDDQNLMKVTSPDDHRTHDDLVAEFLKKLEADWPEVAHYGAPMTTPMGDECAAHKHDEWVPMNWHHVWPQGLGGPDTPDNKVRFCTNAHYATHEFMRQLILHGDAVPADLSVHFGPKIKEFARRGWIAAGSPRHGDTTKE